MIDEVAAEAIWESIQRERNALAESRAKEKRSTVGWIDAIVQRVTSKCVASGRKVWSREEILEVWLIMAIQDGVRWEGVATRLGEVIKGAGLVPVVVDDAGGLTQLAGEPIDAPAPGEPIH